MQFHEAIITFYEEDGKLGSRIQQENSIGEKVSWKDPEYSGYYSRKMNLLQNFLLVEESILTVKFFIVLSITEINLK